MTKEMPDSIYIDLTNQTYFMLPGTGTPRPLTDASRQRISDISYMAAYPNYTRLNTLVNLVYLRSQTNADILVINRHPLPEDEQIIKQALDMVKA